MSPEGIVREDCVTSNFLLTGSTVRDVKLIRHQETGKPEGSGESPEKQPEVWGQVLDLLPPPLASLRNPKNLVFSTHRRKVWKDSAISKAHFCLAILKTYGLRQAINNPLLSTYYVPGTVQNAEEHGL